MSTQRQLVDLRNDARLRSDRVNALARHTNVDVNRYINEAILELYRLLVGVRGAEWFSAVHPNLVTNGTTTLFALVDNFAELLSVRIDYGGGNTYQLEPYSNNEEAELLSLATMSSGSTRPRYAIRAPVQDPDGIAPTFLEVLPAPRTGGIIVVRYLPLPPTLTNDDDALNGFVGWEEYVVVSAAIKICERDDMGEKLARLTARKLELVGQINALGGKRDQGRAARLVDVRRERTIARAARRFGGW